MGDGRGGDDDGVGGVERRVASTGPTLMPALDEATSAARSASTSPIRTCVDARRVAQQTSVQPADAAGAEQRDLHAQRSRLCRGRGRCRRSVAARTRRPIAALSDGGPDAAVLLDHQPSVVVALDERLDHAVEVEQRRRRAP